MEHNHYNNHTGCGDHAVDEMTREFLEILDDMCEEDKAELLAYIKSII